MRYFKVLMACSLVSIVASYSTADTNNTYTFGVVPQQSAKQLAKLWAPLLAEVSKITGLSIQFRTAKDIPSFERNLANGTYDFAYMNPLHFSEFSKKGNYKALAKRKDQKIRGIIVVKKGSELKSISELHGKKLAFPAPAAFAATVLPKSHFNELGIEIESQYVSSHDSVYLSVAKGLFVAGGGVKRTFNNIPKSVRNQLEVFWTTEAYTPHAIAHHTRIEKDILERVKKSLVDLKNTEEGRTLLAALKIKNGIEPAVDTDWNDVRQLNMSM